MRLCSHACRFGVQLLWITAGVGCRDPEGALGVASFPSHATAPRSADASFDPPQEDAQPQPTCPVYVGSDQSSSGIMLEVDGPVWGVRELWISTDGNLRYRSGETGKSPDAFGLPNQQCNSHVRPEDMSALIHQLKASRVCNPLESDDAPASARTLTVCVAAAKFRCSWSAALVKTPAWMTAITRFVRTACEQTGATHPSPGAP
jgi:hypothetical protein